MCELHAEDDVGRTCNKGYIILYSGVYIIYIYISLFN